MTIFVHCPTCQGLGYHPEGELSTECTHCEGSGRITLQDYHRWVGTPSILEGETCPSCRGGGLMEGSDETCPSCEGMGVPAPRMMAVG